MPPHLKDRIIGNWQLTRLLGEGGFGAVYEAVNLNIAGRSAAIKVLHRELALNADMKRRFVNEASAASRADHENIVQVFDGGVTKDGLCYVIMELLQGQSLASLLKAGPLGVARTANIFAQIAAALHAAHSVGIVHRDLKPDNIFVIPRAQNPEFAKVLDFGIAKLHSTDSDHPATRPGMILGTPSHMAPEQWQTLPDIDGRADLYALGIMLFTCLTGAMPFSAAEPVAWLNAHVSHPVPDPGALVPLPAPLATLVQRLLAKRRDDRPRSAAEVQAALLAILQQVSAQPSHPAHALQQAPAPQPPLVVNPPVITPPKVNTTMGQSSGESSQRPARGLTVPLLTGGGLLLLLGAVGWWNQRTSEPPVPPVLVSQPKPPEPPTPAEVQVQPPPRLDNKAPERKPATPLPEELIALGPGRLLLGSGKKSRPDGPMHEVEIERFAIGKTEVSMAEFLSFATAVKLPPPLPWDGISDFSVIAALPATLVTREQADRYCRWRYPRGGGRLPSEAEWEYAATGGGAGLRFPWGDRMEPARVHAGAKKMLLPVNSLALGATRQGMLHALGNVAEWTASEAAPYPGSTAVLRPGAIVRGGAANSDLKDVSVTSRVSVPPIGRYAFIGFRCAASAPEESEAR